MRAVPDTNVIVRAAFRRDDPDSLLRQARRGAFEIVTSSALLSELASVLKRAHIQPKLGWSDDQIESFVQALREASSVVSPKSRIQVVRDESDNRFLEAAIEGQADYIVSADDDLLVLGDYEGIGIVTTARFLAILHAE